MKYIYIQLILILLFTKSFGQSSEFGYPDIPNTDNKETSKNPVISYSANFSISPLGAAQYSIPIEVPLGVNGLHPSISISYNSQNGNGVVGYGMSLNGTSAITRGVKSIYYDENPKGLSFTNDDAIYLDGKRLILMSGSPLRSGAIYQLEDDLITKVVVKNMGHTTSDHNPIWFEVQHADGMLYNYGGVHYNHQKIEGYGTYAWYLTCVEDPYGNYMTYYHDQSDLTMYIKQITYGKNNKNSKSPVIIEGVPPNDKVNNGASNSIIFSYTNRNDSQEYKIKGVTGNLGLRLKSISTSSNDIASKNYILSYNDYGDKTTTKYSRLESIEVQSGNSQIKPISIDWSFLPIFSQTHKYLNIPQSSFASEMEPDGDPIYSIIDMNNDGISDIVEVQRVETGDPDRTHTNIVSVYYASISAKGEVEFSSRKELTSIAAAINIEDIIVWDLGYPAVDMDGDGTKEILIPFYKQRGSVPPNLNFNLVSEKIITTGGGGRNSYGKSFTLENSSIPLLDCGDIENNGKSNIVYVETKGKNGKYIGRIIGDTPHVKFFDDAKFEIYLPNDPIRMYLADMDGDGLQDLIVFHKSKLSVSLPNPIYTPGGYTIFWNQGYGISSSTFTDSHKTSHAIGHLTEKAKISSGDFNGDGLSDFLLKEDNDENVWYFLLNNGNGTLNKKVACNLNLYEQSFTEKDDDKFSVIVTDFDQDGKSDVIITKAMYTKKSDISGTWGVFDKTYTYWMRSTGNNLEQISSATSNKAEDASITRILAGDFNGDGQVDIINYGYNCYNSQDANVSPSWNIYTWGNDIPSRGKINKITDNFGNYIKIDYASTANDKLYTEGTKSVYPVVDLQLPLHVVKSTTESNGVAKDIRTEYLYEGLTTHLQGRGLLGMSSTTIKNITHGITITSGVSTWDNIFYVPTKTYSRTVIGGKMSTTETQFKLTNKANKRFFTYPSKITETDFDGNITTKTSTSNLNFGYLEEERTDYEKGMYKIIKYENHIFDNRKYQPQLVTLTQKHPNDNSEFVQKTRLQYGKNEKNVHYNIQSPNNITTVKYSFDDWGNINYKTNELNISTKYEYDITGRFLEKISTSPEVEKPILNTYDNWGNLIKTQIKYSSLETKNTYDDWNNLKTSNNNRERKKTSVTKGWGTSPSKKHYVLTQGHGEPWVKTWYDSMGREVLVETIGEAGVHIQNQTEYNDLGEVKSVQQQIGDLVTSEDYTYDNWGRVKSIRKSNGQSIDYIYNNRTTTTKTNGKNFIKTVDAWGNVVSSTDNLSKVNYTYTSLGKPSKIVTGDAILTMSYDELGNQISLKDPNAGTYTYEYDKYGRLTKQTDAAGNITTNVFDNTWDRLKSTSNGGSTTTYSYGDYNRINKISLGTKYHTFKYDAYDNIEQKTSFLYIPNHGLVVDTVNYSYNFHNPGKLAGTYYSNGLWLATTYDPYGYRNEIELLNIKDEEVWKDEAWIDEKGPWKTIWKLTSNKGSYISSKLGLKQNILLQNSYDKNGYIKTTRMLRMITPMDMSDYQFNGATGNLISRQRYGNSKESFSYDILDRLTQYGDNNTMEYANNGNITFKSDVGSYSYESRPHAVTSIDKIDNKKKNHQSIKYTSYNKISSIEEIVGADTLKLEYQYGPNFERVSSKLTKNKKTERTIFYIDADHEIVEEGGISKHINYINSPDGLIGIYVRELKNKKEIRTKLYYPHTDHLGSVLSIFDLTDSNQIEKVFEASYDPWGKRSVTNNTFNFHRGYTGHEHMDEFGLINMNARLYDPVLGRFLSPDPYVQMPDFGQNFNRYSYVLNNPLKYTDPSGEFFWIPFTIGFGLGYSMHGISTGNWGLPALAAGVQGGFIANTIAGGIANSMAMSFYNGSSFYGNLGKFAAQMAVSSTVGQLMPTQNLPLGNSPFSIGMGMGLGFGTEGLMGGMNLSLNYSDKNWDLSIGGGVGNNHMGWGGSARFRGYGAGYGRTYYEASNIAGESYDSQIVGTATAYFNHNSFAFSNDALGDKQDRYRTNAVELNIGRYSVGTSLLTNWGANVSEGETNSGRDQLLGSNRNDKGAWKNGQVHFAPLWVGYKNNRGKVTRMGYSHPYVQSITQNAVHKWLTPTPYFNRYDNFRSGGYYYSGYNNPYSIWGQ